MLFVLCIFTIPALPAIGQEKMPRTSFIEPQVTYDNQSIVQIIEARYCSASACYSNYEIFDSEGHSIVDFVNVPSGSTDLQFFDYDWDGSLEFLMVIPDIDVDDSLPMIFLPEIPLVVCQNDNVLRDCTDLNNYRILNYYLRLLSSLKKLSGHENPCELTEEKKSALIGIAALEQYNEEIAGIARRKMCPSHKKYLEKILPKIREQIGKRLEKILPQKKDPEQPDSNENRKVRPMNEFGNTASG
ncbi:hypothetical protein KKC32_03010 [Patescibacteria group bacterium]|nr:hypothetical protein [Patescibacteria group bacterium]